MEPSEELVEPLLDLECYVLFERPQTSFSFANLNRLSVIYRKRAKAEND
jgi:hypothetical protein